jgi:hypothetical protein
LHDFVENYLEKMACFVESCVEKLHDFLETFHNKVACRKNKKQSVLGHKILQQMSKASSNFFILRGQKRSQEMNFGWRK